MLLLRDLICRVAKEHKNVFLVIDALDECDDRAKLFPILGHLAHCLRLFIASRDEGDIRTSFEEFASHSIPIRPSDIQDDIERFVREEIQHRIRNKRLLVGDKHLVDQVAETLMKGADGM
jgi:hypothetical protein